MQIRRSYGHAVLVFALVAWSPAAQASDCSVTSVGFTPLNDLGTGLYLDQFQGGLYPNGSNDVPAVHASIGVARAESVEPLDLAGNPDPAGKYVLLSLGMSNTTQEFCSQSSAFPCDAWTFMGQAAVHPDVDQTSLAIVNGAMGGQASASWDSPNDANYDRIRDTRLAPRGLSEAQVQVVWVKTANPGPTVSLPSANADAYTLVGHMGDILRALKVRYPNVQIVFFTSRIYAGYASTTLNPEPYSYESGFAIKWLVEAQINQMTGGGIDPIAGDLDFSTIAPWIAWGPYPWADGLTPRSDGLIWECSDLQDDGTHPAMTAEEKVGAMLLDFMLNSPLAAPWFRGAGAPGGFISVAITAPPDGATVSGVVTVTGTSVDVGAGVVSVSIDGGPFSPATGTDNWSLDWDTTSVTDGPHSITARARACPSCTSAFDSINVTVDNQGGLSVTITAPADGAMVLDTFTVTGVSSGATSVTLAVDGGVFQPTNGLNPWNAVFEPGSLSPGPHTLTAGAEDGIGGEAFDSISITVGDPPPGSQPIAYSSSVDGETLTAVLRIPSNFDSQGPPLPLLCWLHGGGGTGS